MLSYLDTQSIYQVYSPHFHYIIDNLTTKSSQLNIQSLAVLLEQKHTLHNHVFRYHMGTFVEIKIRKTLEFTRTYYIHINITHTYHESNVSYPIDFFYIQYI